MRILDREQGAICAYASVQQSHPFAVASRKRISKFASFAISILLTVSLCGLGMPSLAYAEELDGSSAPEEKNVSLTDSHEGSSESEGGSSSGDSAIEQEGGTSVEVPGDGSVEETQPDGGSDDDAESGTNGSSDSEEPGDSDSKEEDKAEEKPAAPQIKVNPTHIVKTTASSSSIAVWVSKTSSIEGYQVCYAKASSFTGSKTKSFSKASAHVRINGLKAKTKYYVKVRSYRTVSGKKQYSSWSKAKSVTTKKKTKAKKGKPVLKVSYVAKRMKKQVGKRAGYDMCLQYVELSWIRMGARDTRCIPTAQKYGKKYRVSSSTDIPIGADVFFSGGYSGCGHVGIYIGNGYMISALQGRVKKTKIQDYLHSGGGHKYYGWGYHKDVTVEADSADTATDAFGMSQNLSPRASSTSKGKVKVSWAKSKACSGYQVCVTQGSKKHSSYVSKKSASKTVSKLKSGASCSVKVRPYVVSHGKRLYGSWSSAGSVKVA